jgi:pimeloyl-ACP methyl ester carboxylesterase
LKHVVVVIPGIGGSVLADARGKAVWGPGLGEMAAGLVTPSSLSLSEAPDLLPVDLLRSGRVLWHTVVSGYDPLIRNLLTKFRGTRTSTPELDVAVPNRDPDTSADVVLFPYDFRKGIAHAAERLKGEIDVRLAGLVSEARQRRVIVVAHSMGGLVARYWLGPLGGASDCEALITVATPHRGAPKAMNWLVNGARVVGVRLPGITEVLREWPSVYELMPRYPAVWDESATTARYPFELPETAFDSDSAATHFLSAARRGFGVHADIEQAWSDLDGRCVEVVPLFSRGHRTPTRSELRRGKLTVTKGLADWLPNPSWHGDGTVPAISAIPIELNDRKGVWRPVPERHGPMAASRTVLEVLVEYSGESLASVRGDEPDQPWLGLDLPETVIPRTPFRVTAELLGCPIAVDGPVEMTISEVDDIKCGTRIRLSRDQENRWVGDVPGLPPGLHECVARLSGVPGVDQLKCGDLIGTVTP